MKEETAVQTGRQAPRKPRLACLPVGGVKGRNMNDISSPGSPVLWTESFTHEETVKDVSLVAVAGKKKIDNNLTFLKIRGLLKSFFMLLKHGHWVQDVMTFTL